MRISDWSSDVCSSDLVDLLFEAVDPHGIGPTAPGQLADLLQHAGAAAVDDVAAELVEIGQAELPHHVAQAAAADRSEERRVGQEGVSKCKSRWATYPLKTQ